MRASGRLAGEAASPEGGREGGVLPESSRIDPPKPRSEAPPPGPKDQFKERADPTQSGERRNGRRQAEQEQNRSAEIQDSEKGETSPLFQNPLPLSRALYSAQARCFRASHSLFFTEYSDFFSAGIRFSSDSSIFSISRIASPLTIIVSPSDELPVGYRHPFVVTFPFPCFDAAGVLP